nr:hypothetical protein [Candidatus Sigynarchaeota archaeon]
MAARPVVKDISINLLNAPKELMLGNKSYDLNFMIMNTKSEQKDLVLNFTSESLKMDQEQLELKLGPQEKKNFTLSVTPTADGALDLSVSVVQRKTITYKETVLEGQENVVKEPEPKRAPEKPAAPAVAPSTPVKPVKPAVAPAIPVKPVKPVKPSGEAPPPGKPVKPVKPSGEAPPPAKPVKPAGPSPMELLEKRIGEIRDAYMAARGKLQSIQQGTPEYKDVYQNALKLKEDHDKLKAIFEAGGPVPDDIIKAAAPATPAVKPTAQPRPADPVEELKFL